MIYLDYAATTPLAPQAREAMRPWLDDRFANASALYAAAREARKAIDEAREQIAAAVGCRAEEVVFTSGGTEADNLAIKGAAWHGREQGRDRIVISAVEHHAVADPAEWLARSGFGVSVVPVSANGVIDLEALADAVDSRTAIVSVMWANNEIGTVQPVAQCAEIARAAGAVFHTDAVQALPWLSLDGSGADLMSLAAHKCHGPKGVGALVVKRGTRLQPLLHGGGQERGIRSSTYNTAGIVGFGAAVHAATDDRDDACLRVAALRDRLQEALLAGVPGLAVNAGDGPRLPNSLNVRIPGVESETLLLMLDAAGVAASAGSACSSGALEQSPVLAAVGVPRDVGVLRLTLGRPSTPDEVDRAAGLIATSVERLRR